MDQAQGALRSTLDFRRPKKTQPWLLIGTADAVLVVLSMLLTTLPRGLFKSPEGQTGGIRSLSLMVYVNMG
ncbi:hypothetical protein SAMN05428939_7760 [Streptomyces sp. TLI_105]|nr:hypothetical protein SAMN05428939_7760 [Streptomyces sp. TLI_105]